MQVGARPDTSILARAGAAALLIGALLLPAAAGSSAPLGKKRFGAEFFPNTKLVTHEGKEVRFYDDLIKDKVVVINFIFTSCTDACPAETARLRQVQRELGPRVGDDVFMYSITIDPETDTPEVLAEYRRKFKVAPGWTFLTGDEEELKQLRKKLGVFSEELEDDLSDHQVTLLVGNEATGRWMKRSPFDNPRMLAIVIGDWLHNWKGYQASSPSYAQAQSGGTLDRGEYLFRTRCTSCHSIGKGDDLGPDLMGVVDKRDRAWLERWIREPDVMLREEDPLAVELYRQYNRLPMPNLRLNDVDIAALIDFMQKRSRQVSEERASPNRPTAHPSGTPGEEAAPQAHH